MERKKIWVPEIPPLSAEAQRRAEKVLAWNIANPDLVQAYFDKYEPPEVIQKCQALAREAALNFDYEKQRPRPPSTIVFTPNTVIDTSAATCATEDEDTMLMLLANADPRNVVLKIINPATGIVDDVFKASMIKRYRDDLGIADEVLGAAVLKRHRKDIGESSETMDTISGIAHEVLPGAPALNRFCKELGESSRIVAEDSSAPTSSGATSRDN